jgi:anti-sigma B factor antagonist
MALTSPTRLVLDVRRIGRRAVVAVAGEVDVATAEQLAETLAGTVESGAAEVWVDLAGVDFMDSAGLHVLGEVATRLRALNRRLALICPEGPARLALRLGGFEDVLPVFASRGSAHQHG